MSDNTTNDITNDPIDHDPIEASGPEESNVRYLLARRDDHERTEIEPAGPVLEGEIVTAQEYNARQKAAAIERYKGYRRDAVTVYRGAKTVVTHQRTKTVVRHTLAYPVAGVGVVWQRWRDAHGGNRYERQMRAAEAGGD